MKKTFFLLLFLRSVFVLGDDLRILVGTNEFQVAFADATIAEETRAKIVADLQHEYSSFENGISIQNISGGGYLQFTNVESFPYENGVSIPRNFSRKPEDAFPIIQVDKKLSDKYLRQFHLGNSHTNVFQSAHAFIQNLQNGVLQNMTSNQVSQFFYYENAIPETLAESREKLSHFLDNKDLRQPSILSIFLSCEGVPSLGEVFFMGIPYTDRLLGSRHDALPAVWINGRWKLLLWD